MKCTIDEILNFIESRKLESFMRQGKLNRNIKLAYEKYKTADLGKSMFDKVDGLYEINQLEFIDDNSLPFSKDGVDSKLLKDTLKNETEINDFVLKKIGIERTDPGFLKKLKKLNKEDFIRVFNAILGLHDFYMKIKRKSLSLQPEIEQLLGKVKNMKTLDNHELLKLNKALLQAVYPQETAKSHNRNKNEYEEVSDILHKFHDSAMKNKLNVEDGKIRLTIQLKSDFIRGNLTKLVKDENDQWVGIHTIFRKLDPREKRHQIIKMMFFQYALKEYKQIEVDKMILHFIRTDRWENKKFTQPQINRCIRLILAAVEMKKSILMKKFAGEDLAA